MSIRDLLKYIYGKIPAGHIEAMLFPYFEADQSKSITMVSDLILYKTNNIFRI